MRRRRRHATLRQYVAAGQYRISCPLSYGQSAGRIPVFQGCGGGAVRVSRDSIGRSSLSPGLAARRSKARRRPPSACRLRRLHDLPRSCLELVPAAGGPWSPRAMICRLPARRLAGPLLQRTLSGGTAKRGGRPWIPGAPTNQAVSLRPRPRDSRQKRTPTRQSCVSQTAGAVNARQVPRPISSSLLRRKARSRSLAVRANAARYCSVASAVRPSRHSTSARAAGSGL